MGSHFPPRGSGGARAPSPPRGRRRDREARGAREPRTRRDGAEADGPTAPASEPRGRRARDARGASFFWILYKHFTAERSPLLTPTTAEH
jgi:hypothetical protein